LKEIEAQKKFMADYEKALKQGKIYEKNGSATAFK